jgi:copper(I)-binding protein/cytochrome oxidase Cu insertion factor (SCO1/SenC/PrrC family)
MRRYFASVIGTLLFAASVPAIDAKSPWGANYFPNTPLITQDGEDVRFFDDLIEGKVVLVNFIYTACVDTCPLETAQLVRVQRILGDRLGKDVFFYSISIDPEHDTPAVLAEYKERFGANWTFLTGEESEIIHLRRKLGLYVEEIQDGSLNHNVNMIIGNQATGRWMKRSPFENPYVLADQLGNWLTDWRAPQPKGQDYANAPKLRNISRGEQLYRTRCAICHTVTGVEPEDALGPDLLGIADRREETWLLNWLRAPDQVLESGDPIALALFAQWDNVAMPNMRLNQQEATDLLTYIDDETLRITGQAAEQGTRTPTTMLAASSSEDVVGIMSAWVRETDAAAKANAGYMTLLNVADEDVTLVNIESEAFEKIEMHQMATVDGLMKMRQVTERVIPAKGQARFAPGGWHLMLLGPRQHLTTGETIDMTLVFDSGVQQTVSVKVAAR